MYAIVGHWIPPVERSRFMSSFQGKCLDDRHTNTSSFVCYSETSIRIEPYYCIVLL